MGGREVEERSRPPGPLTLRAPDGRIVRATGKSYGALFAGLGYVPVDEPAPRMRVVAVVHKYPPAHNAGAEAMLHAILRRLAAHGDRVTVVVGAGIGVWELEGVNVIAPGDPSRIAGLVASADVVLTHLDLTRIAMQTTRAAGVPLVHLVHNHEQLGFHEVTPEDAALVVYNSRWIADVYSSFPSRSLIVRPPVFLADYETEPGEAVTLVNMTQAKGAQTFYAAAREVPERPFLGVLGAYGRQINRGDASPNVELIWNTPRIRDDVYRRTRIVLMPSSYESWGRIGIEAACSGIPTIAHPTEGLLESLGVAGIFEDRADVGAYVRRIRELEDPDLYAEASARVRARARELERRSLAELDELEETLLEMGGRP